MPSQHFFVVTGSAAGRAPHIARKRLVLVSVASKHNCLPVLALHNVLSGVLCIAVVDLGEEDVKTSNLSQL